MFFSVRGQFGRRERNCSIIFAAKFLKDGKMTSNDEKINYLMSKKYFLEREEWLLMRWVTGKDEYGVCFVEIKKLNFWKRKS